MTVRALLFRRHIQVSRFRRHSAGAIVRIAEIFHSIQGEGQFAGTPTVFVRTSGCNLRCWFCDTPYASWQPEGGHLTCDELLLRIAAFDCEHVDITGGEPFLQPEISELAERLRGLGHYITIETAGTVYRPVDANLVSFSPKLSNSTPVDDAKWSPRHDRLRDNPEVVRQLVTEFAYQVKFVVDQPADLQEIVEYLARYPEIAREHVWLMPQAITAEALHEKTAWIAGEAERHGYRVSPRLHVELYGNARGK